MGVWIAFILLACSCLATADFELSHSVTKEVVEGDNIRIDCNTTDHPDTEIYWTKQGSGDTYQTGLTLEFTGISRNDSANYTCHSVNTTDPEQNRTVETVDIDVQFPAEITQFSVGPISLMENKTLNVTCDMEGNPNPTWQVRNNRTNNVIFRAHEPGPVIITQIVAVCGEDGMYMCTGRNTLNHGVNVTRGQNVSILCAPRPTPFAPGNYFVSSPLGVWALFFENVIGNPYPTYNWSRSDGKPMGNVEEYSYPSMAGLNISDVKPSDFGNYTLTMSNMYGSSVANYRLVPYGRPQAPMNLEYSDVTYDSVTLHWTSGYDMGGLMYFAVMGWTGHQWIKITPLFTRDYENHGIGQNWTYSLKDISPNTSYTLAVTAKSSQFTSTESNSITVRTAANPNRPSHHHSRLSDETISVIASSVTGCVFLLAVVLLALYLVRRKKRRNPINDKSRLIQ